MENKRTPGPWRTGAPFLSDHFGDYRQSIFDDNISNMIATVWKPSGDDSTEQMQANAAFIVEACNNYERVKAERDELAAAARDLLGVIDAHNRPASCSYDFYYSSGSLRAALAKLDKEEVTK